MMGATAEQIESAIGMTVAHYIPFRAIRAGKQLSDSKGSSAAISTEIAITSVKRSMAGFLGPRDIFRNPEAIFRIFEGPGQMFKAVNATDANTEQADASPFDSAPRPRGDDFAVMGMHFKLGSTSTSPPGAIQAMTDLLAGRPELLDPGENAIKKITITAYEPAFGIIGDPAKRNPTTRQSADHSMVYIIATLLRKAIENKAQRARDQVGRAHPAPRGLLADAINNELTRAIMDKIEFAHGGDEYDSKYPDGIPTSVVIETPTGDTADSGW
jgi:2-methylcitrate dehydratase